MDDNLTRDEARARARLVQDVRYTIELDFAAGDETFGSRSVVHFHATEPGASTFVDLTARSVEELELNGQRVPLEAFDGNRIRLDRLEPDNELRVTARCGYQHTGVGLHRFQDPEDSEVYLHSHLEPFDAHRVFACFDQPDVKGRFDFSVIAPRGWEVISNGRATSREEEDVRARWAFETTPPMPTYITAIVAGPFHAVRDRHRDIDLGVYCRRSLARYLDHEEILEVTKSGLDFFEGAFEYPYAFGKYDQVFVPEANMGAMENAGCVTFNEQYVFRSRVTEAARERRAETILHEMAHMWFGDLVTMRWWDDLWLNESFASFAAVFSQVAVTRWKEGWTTFANSEKTWALRQDQLPTTHPIVADVPDTRSVHLMFDGITYAKGASVLRQLVAWVGEDRFLEGMRAYFRRHEFSNADLTGFLDALEEASGRDLHSWSKEWLQSAGVNTLRPVASTRNDDGEEVLAEYSVRQEAPPDWPTLRSHRVGIGLYDATGDGLVPRRRVELDVVGESTEVPELAGEALPDLALINDGDLTFAKIRFDERSLRTVVEHLGELPDSLARTLCWNGCWDMTRDAEMPAREYLRLVLGHVAGETEIGVVQRLLTQATSAIFLYGDVGNRDAALESLAAASRAQLLAAGAGSDPQLVWARSFISSARLPDHLSEVRGLLDGSTSVGGLDVDTELRWHVVESISAIGGDEELIEQELRRDPTDAGARHAASARAARPVPDAKEKAWRSIVDGDSLPLATLQATMNGFQQPGQEELLRPYAARFFDALLPMWESRDLPVSLAFGRSMYPHTVVEQSVLDLTDERLRAGALPGPIRRLLLEGRDGVARAMRARARDAAPSLS